jgi:hypothetical protein
MQTALRYSHLRDPTVRSPACLPARSLQLQNEAGAREAWLRLAGVERHNGHACHALGSMEQQEGQLEAARLWFERGLKSKGVCVCAHREN